MGWASTWSARNRSTAMSTDCREPQITDWWGQLSWETAMSGRPAMAVAARSAPQPRAA